MGMGELFSKICKSVVKVMLEWPDGSIVTCGIIVALKPSSAYIITDEFEPDDIRHIQVKFPDGGQFDQTRVEEVELCEVDVEPCETVYVYNGIEKTITEGSVTLIDRQHYSVTNIADFETEFGSPVINKNGMLIGVCCSFQYHLTARSIVSIADSIERSHNRVFTSVQPTSQYLHNLI